MQNRNENVSVSVSNLKYKSAITGMIKILYHTLVLNVFSHSTNPLVRFLTEEEMLCHQRPSVEVSVTVRFTNQHKTIEHEQLDTSALRNTQD